MNKLNGWSNWIRAGSRHRRAQSLYEPHFRKLLQSDLIGIAIAQCTGVMTSANDEFLQITGYTREDLNAGHIRFDRITPPEYQDLCFSRLTQAVEQGSCTPYEKEYIRKDGTRVPVLCGLAVVQRSPEEYIGFVRDLTRRKLAECALRERDRPFYTLAEILPQLIWTSDPSGIILFSNGSCLAYTGLTSTEEVASRWLSLIHPEDLQAAFEAWSHSLATGNVFDWVYRLRRYDGVYRYHLAHAAPVTNSAGQITQWIGTLTDVQDRRPTQLI